jgi:hypothetical protein
MCWRRSLRSRGVTRSHRQASISLVLSRSSCHHQVVYMKYMCETSVHCAAVHALLVRYTTSPTDRSYVPVSGVEMSRGFLARAFLVVKGRVIGQQQFEGTVHTTCTPSGSKLLVAFLLLCLLMCLSIVEYQGFLTYLPPSQMPPMLCSAIAHKTTTSRMECSETGECTLFCDR